MAGNHDDDTSEASLALLDQPAGSAEAAPVARSLDLIRPDAVRRMTSTPARRFGFTDRGEIRAGAYADLVLFDPATIVDTGTWAEPTAVPAGIVGVWVNGQRVADAGAVTGARPGRVIHRPT